MPSDQESHESRKWAASFTVSGVLLPPGRPLRLLNGVVAENTQAPYRPKEPVFSSNAIPEQQTGPYPQATAHFLLIFTFEAEDPVVVPRIAEFANKVVLPLRLATLSRVLLDAIALRENNSGLEALQVGSPSPALEPPGLHPLVILTPEGCALIESNLSQLTFNPKFDTPLSNFIRAHYQMHATEEALGYLICLESLFAPGDRSKGKETRVCHLTSIFGARTLDHQRTIRKMLERAYKFRAVIRHGEDDVVLIAAAHAWFNENVIHLKVATAVALQRLLGLAAAGDSFSLTEVIQNISNRTTRERILDMPVIFLPDALMVHKLDMRNFNIQGGGSFTLLPHGQS